MAIVVVHPDGRVECHPTTPQSDAHKVLGGPVTLVGALAEGYFVACLAQPPDDAALNAPVAPLVARGSVVVVYTSEDGSEGCIRAEDVVPLLTAVD